MSLKIFIWKETRAVSLIYYTNKYNVYIVTDRYFYSLRYRVLIALYSYRLYDNIYYIIETSISLICLFSILIEHYVEIYDFGHNQEIQAISWLFNVAG